MGIFFYIEDVWKVGGGLGLDRRLEGRGRFVRWLWREGFRVRHVVEVVSDHLSSVSSDLIDFS